MTSLPLPARPVGSAVTASHYEFADNTAIEGKLNGWRGWFDQQTGLGYNRHGQLASNHNLMAERLVGAGIKSRFIDCEIMGQRTKTGKGTIVVMDAFDPANPKPYAERMKEIEHLEAVTFDVPDNKLLRFVRLTHSKIKSIWEEMEFQNNKAGETIWEGFVMKALNDGKYPFITKPSYCSYEWQKQRIRS
jgi:hypothetical protein